MNIFEISEKFNLSLTKVKNLHKHGVLICDESEGHPLAPAMRDNLRSNQDLSVMQILVLLEKPRVFAELKTRQRKARDQIAALQGSDRMNFHMPKEMAISVMRAAENDTKHVKILMAWIKEALTHAEGEVPYAFLGVRAAIGFLPAGRSDFLTKFAQALMNVRKDPEFTGWFRTDQIGSRKKTFYSNPGLDL